jgi:hypothetical protein
MRSTTCFEDVIIIIQMMDRPPADRQGKQRDARLNLHTTLASCCNLRSSGSSPHFCQAGHSIPPSFLATGGGGTHRGRTPTAGAWWCAEPWPGDGADEAVFWGRRAGAEQGGLCLYNGGGGFVRAEGGTRAGAWSTLATTTTSWPSRVHTSCYRRELYIRGPPSNSLNYYV